MCRSARLHILGAEAEERSDEANDAVLCVVVGVFINIFLKQTTNESKSFLSIVNGGSILNTFKFGLRAIIYPFFNNSLKIGHF